MRAADFYEGVASRYDGPSHECFYRDLAERLVGLVEPSADVRRILDVGSGTGFGTAVLRQRFPHASIRAVEPSSAMRAAARVRLPDVVHEACAFADALAAGEYDLVTCFVAAHWLSAEERDRLVDFGRGAILAASIPMTLQGAPAPGNRLVRQAMRDERVRPVWGREVRRDPFTLCGHHPAQGAIRTHDVTIAETYADSAELADVLHTRGSLMALAGSANADILRDAIARQSCPGPLEFRWSFRLLVCDDRPSPG